jgi:hypothetical protein
MKKLLYRVAKILDIGFVSMLYIVFAIITSKLYDNFLGEFNEEIEAKKGILRNVLELFAMFWIYGIIVYVVRNIVKIIPFPLDNVDGFQHNTLKDLQSATMFTVVFFYFQKHIKIKMQYVFNSMNI